MYRTGRLHTSWAAKPSAAPKAATAPTTKPLLLVREHLRLCSLDLRMQITSGSALLSGRDLLSQQYHINAKPFTAISELVHSL